MVVDASLWVSALLPLEVHHEESRRRLAQYSADDDPLTVPTVVLPEVAGAISRRTGIPALGRQAAEAIVRVPGLRLVSLDAEMASEAARLAADYRLRGADAVYVAVAAVLNLPLLTWDQEMANRAAGVVRVIQLE